MNTQKEKNNFIKSGVACVTDMDSSEDENNIIENLYSSVLTTDPSKVEDSWAVLAENTFNEEVSDYQLIIQNVLFSCIKGRVLSDER